jgi:hypothetical protein
VGKQDLEAELLSSRAVSLLTAARTEVVLTYFSVETNFCALLTGWYFPSSLQAFDALGLSAAIAYSLRKSAGKVAKMANHNGEDRGLSMDEYVRQVTNEITSRVEHQRDVLLKHLEDSATSGEKISYCPLVDCTPREKYRAALIEAVRVLEETRRSFKSKQLEELRKKLQAVLAEDAGREL